jgi:S1-C subfamily serine protease
VTQERPSSTKSQKYPCIQNPPSLITDAEYPSWSPEGSRIVFTSKDAHTENKIFTMDPNGNNVSAIIIPTKDTGSLAFAPRTKGIKVTADSINVPHTGQLNSMSPEQIVNSAGSAVVRIVTDLGSGSGSIISDDGKILTADHVVTGAKNINVYLKNGTKYSATVVGRDMTQDIALLKINAAGLSYLELSDLSTTKLGQQVVVLGYPLNTTDITITTGVVSAIREDDSRNITWIQSDSAMDPGNSGGPMLNAQGKIIGVVAMKAVGFGVEGIGYAISTNTVNMYMPDLEEGHVLY